MTEVEVTIGWKLVDDNNNVVGYKCDYTDNGRCYKDISAYDKQTIMSPIYIPECEFEEEDIVYVDEVTQITEAGTYYAGWINFVRDVLNDVPEVENMSWEDREKIAQYLAKNSLEECDWQSLYTFLESWDWEDCIEDIISFCIPQRKEEFNCVTLSRGDFEVMGYDTSNISDEQMEYIASKIGETLVGNLYWECIREWGNEISEDDE